MNSFNKKLINNGCKLEGIGKYFIEHSKKFSTYQSQVDEHTRVWDLDNKLKNLHKMNEYKGFIIEREVICNVGSSYRYKCGLFIAPRKKDVKDHIDRVIDDKLMVNLELAQLKKVEQTYPDCNGEGSRTTSHEFKHCTSCNGSGKK